ncbi:MAG TPA: hypothetical protein VEF91_01425 [Verrucomicrobiae bacterium]|nr:hypothetical protein [Verrucomicrobiae bacterium]
MSYNLIPFPISIVVTFVFGVAWISISWKLRNKGKIYSLIFYLSLIAILSFFTIIVYSLSRSIFVKPVPIPTPTPVQTGRL